MKQSYILLVRASTVTEGAEALLYHSSLISGQLQTTSYTKDSLYMLINATRVGSARISHTSSSFILVIDTTTYSPLYKRSCSNLTWLVGDLLAIFLQSNASSMLSEISPILSLSLVLAAEFR